jgi:Spy/CpxP family protein refolding chaperone
MFKRLIMAGILVAALASAQRGAGGMGGSDEMGMGGMGGGNGRNGNTGMGETGGGMPRVQRQSREEQIADKLKLNKEQKEQLGTILSAAREKAGPVRDALLKGKLAVAQAIGSNQSDEQMKKVLADYAALAAQMDAVEAEAFGKIYAMLKPNQQSKAGQGFELMAGMFESASRGQGAGMGRGRGEGR